MSGLTRWFGATIAIVAALALTGASSALAAGEYEPNDSLTQTAGPLTAGVNYIATQDTDNDVDWYRFYTGGQVQLTITGTVLNVPDYYPECDLSLRDHRGDELNGTYFDYGEFNDMKQTLYRPGIYYLVIDCDTTGARYRFSLTPTTATVSEACGYSLGARTDAQKDVAKAEQKVAKAKARKRSARGKRARHRAKARLRRARGVARNAQAVLTNWETAVATNC